MFPFDQAALPQLTMGKALIIVDLQNDFIGVDAGDLRVSEPQGFVDRTLKLATAFRARGDVIWIRSKFSQVRPVDDDQIITSDTTPIPVSPSSQMRRQREAEAISELPSAPRDPEAFLSHEEPNCARSSDQGWEMPPPVLEAVKKGDLVLTKSHYSAFQESHLLRALRGKMVIEVFICGSLSNIGVYATALDAARHGMTITVVEDCCGYRHEMRQVNAMRSLMELTGCDIIPSREVLDNLSSDQSRSAPPQERLLSLASPPPASAAISNRKNKSAAVPLSDILQSMNALKLGPASPETAYIPGKAGQPLQEDRDESQTIAVPAASKGEQGLTTPSASISLEIKETSRAETQCIAPDSQRHQEIESQPKNEEVKSDTQGLPGNGALEDNSQEDFGSHPQDGLFLQHALCEGDTDVLGEALSNSLADTAFELLQHEVRWQRMAHQGGEVPRLVAVQGEIADDGSMPLYRHPADESPPLLPFSPTVLAIKSETEKHLGHSLNHVLIQFYRDGNDYISEHSDKTLDIVAGSFIANVSLGAERTMVLRTKKLDKDPSWKEALPSDLKRKIQRARLPHNSLFRMGLQTNMKWMHAIRQDKREDRDKSMAELAYAGRRISLTFRNIGTFLNRDETLIWGQGAAGKTKDTAHSVINGQNPEAVKMLRAFGAENHSSDFDWQAQYGDGFDVLHISNSPRFFASADAIVNTRITLQLAQYGITFAKGSMAVGIKPEEQGPGSRSIPLDVPVRFIDNDAAKSVVNGEIAIMLYLEACYGGYRDSKAESSTKGKLATKLTRFQQGLGLSRIWRHFQEQKHDGSAFTKSLKTELETWDELAAKTKTEAGLFIAEQDFCLADFAVWPVLRAIREDVGPDAFDGLENLQLYYEKVADLDCAKKILGKTETQNGSQ